MTTVGTPNAMHYNANAGGEPPGMLRAMAIGSAIGVVATLIGITGILLLNGQQLSVALGIGGMSAFWGGLGFGSMLGGVTHVTRQERATARHSVVLSGLDDLHLTDSITRAGSRRESVPQGC